MYIEWDLLMINFISMLLMVVSSLIGITEPQLQITYPYGEIPSISEEGFPRTGICTIGLQAEIQGGPLIQTTVTPALGSVVAEGLAPKDTISRSWTYLLYPTAVCETTTPESSVRTFVLLGNPYSTIVVYDFGDSLQNTED